MSTNSNRSDTFLFRSARYCILLFVSMCTALAMTVQPAFANDDAIDADTSIYSADDEESFGDDNADYVDDDNFFTEDDYGVAGDDADNDPDDPDDSDGAFIDDELIDDEGAFESEDLISDMYFEDDDADADDDADDEADDDYDEADDDVDDDADDVDDDDVADGVDGEGLLDDEGILCDFCLDDPMWEDYADDDDADVADAYDDADDDGDADDMEDYADDIDEAIDYEEWFLSGDEGPLCGSAIGRVGNCRGREVVEICVMEEAPDGFEDCDEGSSDSYFDLDDSAYDYADDGLYADADDDDADFGPDADDDDDDDADTDALDFEAGDFGYGYGEAYASEGEVIDKFVWERFDVQGSSDSFSVASEAMAPEAGVAANTGNGTKSLTSAIDVIKEIETVTLDFESRILDIWVRNWLR